MNKEEYFTSINNGEILIVKSTQKQSTS